MGEVQKSVKRLGFGKTGIGAQVAKFWVLGDVGQGVIVSKSYKERERRNLMR